MGEAVNFLIAGLLLTGSPGPNTLSLAATGAAFGARAGARYLVGLVTGMLAVMIIVSTGLASLVFALPGARIALGVLAAGYFAYLAVRIATAPPLGEPQAGAPAPSFTAGMVLSLVNPKAYAAMAALFSGFVLVHDRLAVDTAVKIATLAAIVTLVCICWLLAGSALTKLFRDPRSSRVINVTFAVLLVASLGSALLL